MDDQLAVNHDISEGLRLEGRTVAVGLAQQFHQYLGGLGPLAIGILFDGGHRRSLEVVCDRQVGIADETNVFVNPELLLPGVLHGVEGDVVVDGEDGCRFGALAQQMVHALECSLPGEVGGGDEPEIDLQSSFDKDLHIGIGAFLGGPHLFWPIEHADAAVAFGNEKFDSLAGTAIHIGVYLIEIGQRRDAVEEYDGDTVFFEGSEMVVGGGIGAEGDDKAVDAVVLHGGDDHTFALSIVPGLADEDVVFVVGGYLFDAVDGFVEELLFQVGQDYADGGRLALFEEDGGLVGFVVQLLRQLLHPRFRPQADARMVMEGPADGGDRHVELFGDLLDGGELVFFHVAKIGYKTEQPDFGSIVRGAPSGWPPLNIHRIVRRMIFDASTGRR